MNMELQKQADLLLSKWHQSAAARAKDMSSSSAQSSYPGRAAWFQLHCVVFQVSGHLGFLARSLKADQGDDKFDFDGQLEHQTIPHRSGWCVAGAVVTLQTSGRRM